MGEIELEDRIFADAVAQGSAERANSAIPTSVRYDRHSERIVVEFNNGAAFMVPAIKLQGLSDASPEDIAQVELAGETGLHWPTLDVDLTVAGLMQGIFGTAKFMDAARQGGLSRSPAKIAAARRNGLRGGRPKKAP